MTITIGAAAPRTGRRKTTALLAAAAILLTGGLSVAQAQSAQADGTETITLASSTVEQGDYLWYELEGFIPNTDVVLGFGNAAEGGLYTTTVEIGADGKPTNPDGQTYQRVPVPRDTPLGSNPYDIVVFDPTWTTLIVQSGPITVTAATNKVTNPGDHSGGVEDVGVQPGGSWTFNAKAFAPNAHLHATATIGGSTVALAGIGQEDTPDVDGPYWQLNADGDTDPLTRVKLANPTTGAVPPAGPLAVTFTDGTTSIVRTLTVEAAVAATAKIVNVTPTEVWVVGEGWPALTATDRGAVVAVKIDEGAYSHVSGFPYTGTWDGTSHAVSNLTVWDVIVATEDGTFDDNDGATYTYWDDDEADFVTSTYAVVTRPTGTTGTWGSSPALTGTGHTLRLLSGSLGGDASRTVLTAGTF